MYFPEDVKGGQQEFTAGNECKYEEDASTQSYQPSRKRKRVRSSDYDVDMEEVKSKNVVNIRD